MSIFANVDLEGIKRTTNVVDAPSNYSCVFWYKPNGTPGLGTYRTAFFTADSSASYSQYVGIYENNVGAGGIYLEIDNNITNIVGTNFPVNQNLYNPIVYVREGLENRLYLNGILVETLSLDFSAATFGEIWMMSDGYTNETNENIFGFTEINEAKTLEECLVALQTGTFGAGSTTVTPLLSDLLDDSGNGNDWTAVGAVSFVPWPSTWTLIDQPTVFPYSRLVTQAEFNISPGVFFQFLFPKPIVLGNFTNKGGNYSPSYRIYDWNGSTVLRTVLEDYGNWWLFPAGVYFIALRNYNGLGTSNFDFTVQFDTRPVDEFVISEGQLVVNDDGEFFAATLVSSGGEILSFLTDIPSGEIGAILPSNISLWHDRYAFLDSPERLALVDEELVYELSVNSTPAIDDFPFPAFTNNDTDFYVCDRNNNKIWKVTSAGVITDTGATLPSTPSSICISADGSILYYTISTVGIIQSWVIATNSAGPDFYTIPTFVPGDILALTPNGHPGDMFRLPDNSIVTYWHDTSIPSSKLIHIDSGGILLNEYEYLSPLSIDHLAYILNSITQIKIWLFTDIDRAQGRFATVRLSDGINLSFFDTVLFDNGVNLIQSDETMFAPSNSCTFVRMMEGEGPPSPNLLSGIYKVVPRFGKRNDTLYINLETLETEDVKIPRPFARGSLLGQ